jgi:hypothetical protein
VPGLAGHEPSNDSLEQHPSPQAVQADAGRLGTSKESLLQCHAERLPGAVGQATSAR